ncbi:MAG: polysaccharide biosynthesis/export family protein [bacterium]
MRISFLAVLPIILIASCATPNNNMSSTRQPVNINGIQQTTTTQAIPIDENNKNNAVNQLLKSNEQTTKIVNDGLGVGDSISITVWGHPDMSGVARIEKDGKLYLPLIGGIQAKGLTIEQLRDEITKACSLYIRHPFVDVEVKEYASRLVLVLGSVAKPGIYPVKGGTDLVTAIALAGGQLAQSQQANLSSVYLIRNGHATIVNVYDYLHNGNEYNDPTLENKDVIYVPNADEQNIIVLGYVDKPIIIPVSGAPVSIVQAITLAGGFKVGALKNDVKVIRGGLIHPDIYTVNVDDILHGEKPSTKEGLNLYAGDIVFVPKSALASWNEILEQIQPTLNVLLAQPLSIATNYLLLRQLLR